MLRCLVFKDLDAEAATLGREALGSGSFSFLPVGRWAEYAALVSSAPNLGQSVVIPSRSAALGSVNTVSGQSPKSRLRMEQTDLSLNSGCPAYCW